jgi:hypothetical protein
MTESRTGLVKSCLGGHGGEFVSFMDYDLGNFDDETCRLEPLANPFGPKVLPMSSVKP